MRWPEAAEAFLRRDLAPGSRRVYKLTLDRLQRHLDADRRRCELTPTRLAEAYPDVSPATWNRVVATIRSFTAFCRRQGWIDADLASGLERRRMPADYSRSLPAAELEQLFTRRSVPLRGRTFGGCCTRRLTFVTRPQ